MAKTKSSKKSSSSKNDSSKSSSKTDSKSSSKNTCDFMNSFKRMTSEPCMVISLGIMLLLGLIIGGLITFGAFLPQQDNVSDGTACFTGMDVANVKTNTLDYLNTYLINQQAKEQGIEFSLDDGTKVNEGLYEFGVYVDQNGQEQLLTYVYSTGETLILSQGEAIDLSEEPQVPETTESAQTAEQKPVENQEFSEEEKQEIISFNECIAEKGIKIYGANWCGYTKALVENLGGFDLVGTSYVECTENKDLCAEKEIKGYPTILLDGEKVSSERNFEGLSEITGCEVPNLNDVAPAASGSC